MRARWVILSGFCASKKCIEGCARGFDTILPLVESLSLTNLNFLLNE